MTSRNRYVTDSGNVDCLPGQALYECHLSHLFHKHLLITLYGNITLAISKEPSKEQKDK